jgi:hypothetical protein
MSVWKVPSTSVVYVGPVTIPQATTDMPVKLALIPRGVDEPADADWHAADIWDSTGAWLRIGPGTDRPLTDGLYQMFAQVTAGAEVPVIEVENGLVRIT